MGRSVRSKVCNRHLRNMYRLYNHCNVFQRDYRARLVSTSSLVYSIYLLDISAAGRVHHAIEVSYWRSSERHRIYPVLFRTRPAAEIANNWQREDDKRERNINHLQQFSGRCTLLARCLVRPEIVAHMCQQTHCVIFEVGKSTRVGKSIQVLWYRTHSTTA